MDDTKRSQSPEELGEAVGRKIEELFGGVLQSEADKDTPTGKPAASPASGSVPEQAVKQDPGSASGSLAESAAAPAAATPESHSTHPANHSASQLMDRIEAHVLELDWETKMETIRDLIQLFKELGERSQGEETVRILLTMNNRILQRVLSSQAAPPPSLVKFLQDSVGVLKRVAMPGSRPSPDESSLVDLKDRYQKIMAATQRTGEAEPETGEQTFESLVENVGISVRSLSEVSQRLSRILAVFRQGGDMSGEEITRRLGTLEKLLAENVTKLGTLQSRLSHSQPGGSGGTAPDAGKPNGVIMVLWGGTPLAIPSSIVSAVYTLTKEQAKPLIGKSVVTLGSGPVRRLPLKKPRGGRKAVVPSLLIHLTWGEKGYFLLADRSLGYRRAPEGADLLQQNRIKIGSGNYVLLNPAAFRSGS